MPGFSTRSRWLVVVLVGFLGFAIFDSGSRRLSDAREPATGPRLERADTTEPTVETRRGPDLVPPPAAAGAALFTYVQPDNAATLDAALPAPAREIHYVQLNTELIVGKRSPFWQKPRAGRIEIPVPTGESLIVVIDDSEMLGVDRWTSRGRIEGRPASRAVFAWHGGFLHASIEDPLLGGFALRAATETVSQFYRLDPELIPICGGGRRPEDGEKRRAAGANTPPAGASPSAAAADDPPRVEVHVMMLHTQAVLPTLSGAARTDAVQSAFDLAIAKTNDAFAASRITARVRLVKIAEVRHPGDDINLAAPDWHDDALTALYRDDDGRMDEIHALRDEAGADIVVLALNRRDTASSGLSFLLDEAGDGANAEFAFSVVQYSLTAGTNVVPHELGHIFGCAHDRPNAASGPGAYSYSYGHRFLGADGAWYHDIMSYPRPPGSSISAIEVSYFSTPRVVVPAPVNMPPGIAAGLPDEADTALTIDQNAVATANYRLHTSNPNAGSLTNVATRAFVGRDEEVLIGGFIVEGAQPKRMLIRAAGPALAAFGVANALADPILRIFQRGTMTAENDNWAAPAATTAASLSEIHSATSQTGAFPFALGSADAALLVALPPGAYTAVIEGVAGATGFALVEAYEVDRDDVRIVNLATRGYADRSGKEMVGGFVVHGAPGTTKRILVRVLGPTLARAPFHLSATLYDPEMEIRNAAGELLVKNDDWSGDADGGPSNDNDFRPRVRTYGERQIFATGHAPGNRREPCVLMDLPPGSYTVLVRPFEFRSPNPLFEQLAEPGVGVVEVYEIK